MRSEFERGLQVLDGGLAGLRIERAGLEQNIRARFFEPLANVPARLGLRGRPVAMEDGEGAEAIGVGHPAGAARGHTCQPPAHVIAAAQL